MKFVLITILTLSTLPAFAAQLVCSGSGPCESEYCETFQKSIQYVRKSCGLSTICVIAHDSYTFENGWKITMRSEANDNQPTKVEIYVTDPMKKTLHTSDSERSVSVYYSANNESVGVECSIK